jgi:small subunit ribosomal protein S20
MAHSKSARKRNRQDATHRDRNRGRKSALRTQIKKVRTAIAAGDAEQARAELQLAMKKADKTAKTNTIHPNAAARIKSRLSRAVDSM